MKKLIFLIPAVLLSFSVFAKDEEYAHHPTPVDPLYIEINWYETLKAQVPPPPTKNSSEQKADEQTMLEKQKTRTPKDCERANTEVYVGLGSLYGKPQGPLTEENIKALSPFFDQIKNDSAFFFMKLKNDFHRDRPFVTLTQLKPCVPKEASQSYPSGHATISAVFALVLEDLYPDQKELLEERAKQIASDRVLAGVHYPTDINEGREIAKLIYTQLKKSVRFNSELTMMKKKLAKN